MLYTKKKFLAVCPAVAIAVSVLTFAILSKVVVFATTNYLTYTADSLSYSDEAQTATVVLTAGEAMDAFAMQADFAVTETDDTNNYFTLTSMEYSDLFQPANVISDEIGDTVGRFIWMANTDADVVSFSQNDTILVATYTVAAGTPSGTYNLPITNPKVVFSNDAGSYSPTGGIAATIRINGTTPQEISFADDSVDKKYGDANFIITANHTVGDGAVTYKSQDESVAMVDPDTGEVTIVGVGDTLIIATAGGTDTYAETTASYLLNVSKKTVNITSASVSNKVYDGTIAADINGAVELSDSSLVYGTEFADGVDFIATAEFEDANAGENKNVTVTVTLSNEKAELYEINGNFTVEGVKITPFVITSANVLLAENEFTYSGAANEPELMVMVQLDGVNDTILIPNSDYIATYDTDTVNVGTKNVTVAASGNYTTGSNEIEVPYTVAAYRIKNSDIHLEYTVVQYDGTPKTPEVSVMIGNFKVNSDEYGVGYSANTGVGPATVTVTAKADKNITGVATTGFEIVDKNILAITGIENQEVTYTDSPVRLAGTLAVGANTDGITVNDLTTKWYASDGTTEIAQPVAVGSYKVVYSYNGINYMGSLEVEFDIVKATSPAPAEMSAAFRVESGTRLSGIPGARTIGFSWVDSTTAVLAGEHSYAATYTYNNDTNNYTTLTLNVPVYGATRIAITALVDGDGGTVSAPVTALEGDSVKFEFSPANNYEIEEVLINGNDVTGLVVNNALDITVANLDLDLTVKYRKIYIVVEGDGESYEANKGQSAVFKINAEHELFSAGGKVYVDGVLIAEKYYRHSTGSTVITLTDEFIATLASGTHALAVVFSDGGVARASFVVSNPAKDGEIAAPDTGASTAATNARIAGFTMFAVVLASVVFAVRRNFAKSKIDFNK